MQSQQYVIDGQITINETPDDLYSLSMFRINNY